MRRFVSILCLLGIAATTAQAAPVDEQDARKFLFPVRGVFLSVAPNSGLDASQQAITKAILESTENEGAALYYGAMAVSPSFFAMMATDPGAAALSGLLQITQSFHSAEAASRAALKACEDARERSHDRCVLAGHILPRRYSARPLQMSVGATHAFSAYRKGKGAKAFAISPTTTAYAIGQGADAAGQALTKCNTMADELGATDCEIVIQD